MSQLDALALAYQLRQRLVDFGVSQAFTSDSNLSRAMRKCWAQNGVDGLVGDIWVEASRASESSGKNLRQLAHEGLFSSWLADRLAQNKTLPDDIKLYTHQVEAIKTATASTNTSRPAIGVTAGTGGGKTESFLLPILNQLVTSPRRANNGIRALILYPMNALVNDQVERLDKWLAGQNEITFFHFTSETPESARDANLEEAPPATSYRFRTRQQARGKENCDGVKTDSGPQPDVLITNYSMLEYMLCRPQDAVFFSPALEAIVLDEAHLYAGTLATEIMLLLRRMMLRCDVKSNEVLQIATSATLGGTPDELKDFVSTLFSSPLESTELIQGTSADYEVQPAQELSHQPDATLIAETNWVPNGTLSIADGEPRLLKDNAGCEELAGQLRLFVCPGAIETALARCESQPALLLWHAMSTSPLVHRLADAMKSTANQTLDQLAIELWCRLDDTTRKATTQLLRLAASARLRSDRLPLLPHRLHLQVRAPTSLSTCLFEGCRGDDVVELPPLGSVTSDTTRICRHCDSPTYPIVRCDNCGCWGIAAVRDGTRMLPTVSHGAGPSNTDIILVPEENVMAPPGTPRVVLDSADGNCAVATGASFYNVTTCPRCQAGEFKWLSTGDSLSLSIATETLLAELPPMSNGRTWKPAEGRRLLTFSDSRQAAARLGPRLATQHERQMFRALIARHADAELTRGNQQRMLERDIGDLETKLADNSLDTDSRTYYETELADKRIRLQQMRSGGTINQWSEKLQKDPLISQFLDHDKAKEHPEFEDEATGTRHWSFGDWSTNNKSVRRRIPMLIAAEFASRPRNQPSAETIGLVSVTYPGIELLTPDNGFVGLLPAASRAAIESAYGDICHLVCDAIRIAGCVDLGSDKLNFKLSETRPPVGFWMSLNSSGKSLKNLAGQSRNETNVDFAARVLIAAGVPEVDAERRGLDLLSDVFRSLTRAARQGTLNWIQAQMMPTDDGGEVETIRFTFGLLALQALRQGFECELNGWIWSRAAIGCVPQRGTGALQLVQLVDLGSENRERGIGRHQRLRRDYIERDVFKRGLWAEEHSAQLSAKETRRLQSLFREGARNLLSCTTTMELGIDIGGLVAVMMGNVPPGKANYLQRAGRAGRRSDGSSAVITFCQSRPFERAVYYGFRQYLNRLLRKPRVIVDRPKLVRRQFCAWLIGSFFSEIRDQGEQTGAMNAFGKMGRFCGMAQSAKWKKDEPRPTARVRPMQALPDHLDWIGHPSSVSNAFLTYLGWARDAGNRLKEDALELLRDTPLFDRAKDHWSELIVEIETEFSDAVTDWQTEYEDLLKAWELVEDNTENGMRQANAIHRQLATLYAVSVIESLSNRQFLPRYGFPVNVHRLAVQTWDEKTKRVREGQQYRLERGGLMAIREYIPGATLMAGGNFVKSRGLNRLPYEGDEFESFGERKGCRTCRNEHFYFRPFDQIPNQCEQCDGVWQGGIHQVLLPRHGFSTAAWDEPKRKGSLTSLYHWSITRIDWTGGDPSERLSKSDFAGIPGLTATYRDDGKLVVLNRGEYNNGFIICTRCGYSESEPRGRQAGQPLPPSFTRHLPLWMTGGTATEHGCVHKNKAVPLQQQWLGSTEPTDMLRLSFTHTNLPNDNIVFLKTLQVALHRGGAELLQLDPRELGAELLASQVGTSDIVIYDNVPGGAGHTRELIEDGENWFALAKQILRGTPEHDARCPTACLDCILGFESQSAVEAGQIDRKVVLQNLA